MPSAITLKLPASVPSAFTVSPIVSFSSRITRPAPVFIVGCTRSRTVVPRSTAMSPPWSIILGASPV